MMTKSESITVQFTSNLSHEYEYQFDGSFDIDSYNFIALQQLIFPKNFYDISSFTITVDSTDIDFEQGQLSFDQLIAKLSQVPNITCTEYLQTSFQNSGKLFIQKNDLSMFTLTIPTEETNLFGQLQWDASQNAYISQYICNLTQNRIITIQSNCVYNLLKQNDRYTNLTSFSTDQYLLGQFFQQEYDIIQHKRRFSKSKSISFRFINQDNNDITFLSNSKIFMRLVLFQYEYDFINIFFRMMKQQNSLLQLKYFPDETYQKIYGDSKIGKEEKDQIIQQSIIK